MRKRSKHRMSVDYPRDVENVAPAATSKAKAAPRSPILERRSPVGRLASPQKKVPATTPTPAPTPVPEATTPARLPEDDYVGGRRRRWRRPGVARQTRRAGGAPRRKRACFFW